MFHILLNPADNLARCTRLYCVSIDPSELYHIAQSCCLLHAFTPLWRLCTRLLSAIHWFPLVSWFSSFHALRLRALSRLWYSEWFGLKHLYGTYASATFTSLKAKLPLIEFNVEIYNKIYFNIQQSFFFRKSVLIILQYWKCVKFFSDKMWHWRNTWRNIIPVWWIGFFFSLQEFNDPSMTLLHTYVSISFNWFCLIGKVKRWICVHHLSHSKMVFHVTEGSQKTV